MAYPLSPARAAFLVLAVSAATLGGAWAFQYGLGYEPCALCLEQRVPYYFGIPLALLSFFALSMGHQRAGAIGLLGFAALFAYGTGLAVYHSGVEWSWWAGPAGCAPTVGLETDASKLFESLSRIHAPSCTEAAWRFLGLSLAGYNALISAALVLIASLGALGTWKSYRSGKHT